MPTKPQLPATRRRFLQAAVSPVVSAPFLAVVGAAPSPEEEKIGALTKRAEPVTWVLTGDSITHGALHTNGWRSYPEHFAERIRWELGRVRDVVINTGISGDRVPGLQADLEHRVLRFKPDVVSIMMGMNDASAGEAGREDFRSAYNRLVETLEAETDATILLHTPNPITPAASGRADLPAYSQIVREVAEAHGTALVDQERLWNEYLREEKTDLNYLLADGTIHPNEYGHILFAHILFKALGIFDPASNVCRLFVP